jgi:hypothetical protein
MLPAARGTNVFWIELELLTGVPESQRLAKAAELLNQLAGERQTLVRLEPVHDSEQVIQGYLVFTHP